MNKLRHSTTCDYLVRHRSCDCRLSSIHSECQQGSHANCTTGGWDSGESRSATCLCTCHSDQPAVVLQHQG
jgi:hypothetical protein